MSYDTCRRRETTALHTRRSRRHHSNAEIAPDTLLTRNYKENNTLTTNSLYQPQLDAKIAGNGQSDLTGLLHPDMLIPGIVAEGKIEAIKKLIDRLSEQGIIDDSLAFLQAVLERENLQSTVLDGVIALPHARGRMVHRLGVAIGTSPERSIDFPSGDERHNVGLICLIAVPADAPGLYLRLIGVLARAFSERDFVDTVIATQDATQMHQLLADRLEVCGL